MRTIRVSLLAAAAALVVLALAPGARSQETASAGIKIGAVRLSVMFKSYKRAQELETQAAAEEKAYMARVEGLVREVKALKEELGNLDPNGELYARMRRDISLKQGELDYLNNEEKQRLQRKLDEMTQSVLHDLEDAIRGYGAERGYTVIFRVDEAPDGVDRAVQFAVTTVLYYDPATDITEDVTAWLNARTPAAGRDGGGQGGDGSGDGR